LPWDDKTKGSGPWGGGGGDGKGSGGGEGSSPWNRPSGGGDKAGGDKGGGGNKESPDLEEQMRRMQERFRQRRGGNGGGGGRRKGPGGAQMPNFGPLGLMVVGGVVLLSWLSTGIVIVDPTQQAAVFRFGKWQTNFGPGLHFHLPAPIENHTLLNVETRNEKRIGSNQEESLMLTQDENIVDIRFTVQYRLSDARSYLFENRNPDEAVVQASESAVREIVGRSKVDSVLLVLASSRASCWVNCWRTRQQREHKRDQREN
jgi:membrane protease subunit HflK